LEGVESVEGGIPVNIDRPDVDRVVEFVHFYRLL